MSEPGLPLEEWEQLANAATPAVASRHVKQVQVAFVAAVAEVRSLSAEVVRLEAENENLVTAYRNAVASLEAK